MREIAIRLNRTDLLNDIRNRAHAASRRVEGAEAAALVRRVTDEENRPMLLRALCEGWDVVRNACAGFLETGRVYATNAVRDDEELEMLLPVADDYNLANTQYLCDCLHGMLVRFVLVELGVDVEKHSAEFASYRLRVSALLNSNTGIVRRKRTLY